MIYLTLQIRIKLPFEDLLPFKGNLWFEGHPPKNKEEGLKFEFEDGYIGYVYFVKGLNQYSQEANTYATDSIRVPSEFKHKALLKGDSFVRNLTLVIEKENPDAKLITFIKENRLVHDNVEAPENILFYEFLIQSIKFFDIIHEFMVSYIRSIKKQFWLRKLSNPRQYFEQRPLDIQVVVDGEVYTFENLTLSKFRSSILDKKLGQSPITSLDLKKIVELFKENRNWKPSMYNVLITNSFQLFTEKRLREALISAVTALEHAISVFFKKRPCIVDEEKAKTIMKIKGLKDKAKLGLKELFHIKKISQNYDKCLKAIDERNLVIHNAKTVLDLAEIQEYILAIHDIIQALWEYNQSIAKH